MEKKIQLGAKDLVELGRAGVRKWAKFGSGYLPGWSKHRTPGQRRAALERLTAREGCVRVIRKLTQLRNVTRDHPTAAKAKADARWLHKQGFCHLKSKKK